MSKDNPGLIRRFFNFLYSIATFIKKIVTILVVLWLVLVVWVFFAAVPKPPVLPQQYVLNLDINGSVVEEYKGSPADVALAALSGEPQAQTLFTNLIMALKHARDDSSILAINIDATGMLDIMPAQLSELVTAIDTFKATTAKPVYIHSEIYDKNLFYLATAADKVVLDPLGAVIIDGYAVYQNYFKDGLDKIGVTANVFRAGLYKSAVEPFLRNDMSAEAKVANQQWLGVLWENYRSRVLANRTITLDQFQTYTNNPVKLLDTYYNGDAAQAALALGLVDELATWHNYRDSLEAEFGVHQYSKDVNGYPSITVQQYLNNRQALQVGQQANIAVVALDGAIMDSDYQNTDIDSYRAETLIDWVADSDKYQAMVLRVNSPGGTITASERIRRAVLRVKQAGMPVVVSMSGMAASGGYWISAPAEKIVASPTTITGSIGVFGVLPTAEKGLNKLGIYTDGLGTTELAGSMRLDRNLSPQASAAIQSSVQHSYTTFLNVVSEGRGIDIEQVRSIASGRVWSGSDAQANRLVDELGGLEVAVKLAAEEAGLNPQTAKFQLIRDEQAIYTEKLMQWTANISVPSLVTSTFSGIRHRLKGTVLDQYTEKFLGQFHWLTDAFQGGKSVYTTPNYIYCMACETR